MLNLLTNKGDFRERVDLRFVQVFIPSIAFKNHTPDFLTLHLLCSRSPKCRTKIIDSIFLNVVLVILDLL